MFIRAASCRWLNPRFNLNALIVTAKRADTDTLTNATGAGVGAGADGWGAGSSDILHRRQERVEFGNWIIEQEKHRSTSRGGGVGAVTVTGCVDMSRCCARSASSR